MRRIFKRMTALAALTALVLCAGCGAPDQAPAAAEARTGERETLGLLMAREDPFLTELKEQIQAEAAARGYDVRAYNAGNDPEAQLRQVHQALADGVETLLVVSLNRVEEVEGIEVTDPESGTVRQTYPVAPGEPFAVLVTLGEGAEDLALRAVDRRGETVPFENYYVR